MRLSPGSCYVTARDHAQHWGGRRVAAPLPLAPPSPYAGPDRRVARADRRGGDRRSEAARGRRYRLTDRRKAPRPA